MSTKQQAPRNRPTVSSLSMTFKRKAGLVEDIEEAKKDHRLNLKNLIDTYMEDIQKGRATGIRNAKELVELIKADLLLMGEATDRTETSNSVDEIRVQQISTMITDDNENMQAIMAELFESMNATNDRFGGVKVRPEDHKPKYDEEGNDAKDTNNVDE